MMGLSCGTIPQSVVEYTITRGKRVIQNEKTVLLPKGINFKNGKAGLLKAYDLEENKWDLVHDDRVMCCSFVPASYYSAPPTGAVCILPSLCL